VLVLVAVLQPVIAGMLEAGAEAVAAVDEGVPDQAAGEPHRALWRFLLGNTLPRMLEALHLPQSRVLAWWRAAAALDDSLADGTSAERYDEAAAAACELAAVLLAELAMGQAPHATVAILRRWRGEAEEGRRRAMADLEALHAQAVELKLEA
jgi:hypothetical protein